MSQTKSIAKEAELQEEEKEELLARLKKHDVTLLRNTAEALSMFARAFEGKPVEPENVIKTLIDHKNIMERSRFPTYPLLAKQVFLRLVEVSYGKEAQICGVWADLEAQALIEYKGQGREEYVDVQKAATQQGSEQQFYLGPRQPQERPKRRWSLRKPKTEDSEFVST